MVGLLSLVHPQKRMTTAYIIPGLVRKGLLCQVYYKARDLALSNNHDYHLAAYTKVRSTYRLGVNSNKKSVKFKRRYRDGTFGYHLHAEMDLIRQFPEGSVKEITVVRFMKMETQLWRCHASIVKDSLRGMELKKFTIPIGMVDGK